MLTRYARLTLAVCLCAGLLPAQPHPPVKDKILAANLRDRYLTVTDGWAKIALFTPAEQAAMVAGRRWEALMMKGPDDPLARKILASGEPGFESVSAYYPGKVLDRTILGTYSDPAKPASGYDDESTIWWNGAISADLFFGTLTDRLGATGNLAVGHNTNILFRVGPDAEMYGLSGPHFKRIAYEDGYLPIVVSTYEHDGIRYRQTALADQPAGETNGWDIAFVRFELTNIGKNARDAWLSEDVILIDGGRARFEGRRIVNAGGATLFTYSDPDAQFDAGAQRLAHKLRLAPGHTASIVFKIPYIPDSENLVKPATNEQFDAAHGRQRDFWLKLLAGGARIQVPEQRVNDVWRALLLQNYVLADGPRLTYGSGLRYNSSTYPQESNFAAHTFALYGMKDYANALQPHFVPMAITPKGAGRKYQNRRAMPLHHLLENWRLTGRTDVFEKFKDDFYRVAEEIISGRRSTMKEENGARPLHWGLLPPDKPGADVQASTRQVYVLGHNITNCQGLMDFGTFLVRSGIDPARGERYIREAAGFRQTLMSAMERAAIRLPGRPPFIDLQTLYTRETPDYGPEPYDDLALGRLQGAYYHYWADMELHYNFFNPEDQVAHWLADYVRQRNGFVLGSTRGQWHDWSPYGWVNNVYEGGYYNYKLRCGNIDEFLLGFYSRLAYGMTRHVYVSAEGSPFIGYNTQLGGFVSADYSFPNSASNADTLLMLRNMLVYEELKDNVETGILYVLRGAPRRWLEDGKRIEVNKLVTYFGDVSFTVDSRLKQNRILASLQLPRHPSLRGILVPIRHPKGAAIARLKVNGKPYADFDAKTGEIRLAAGQTRYLLELSY